MRLSITLLLIGAALGATSAAGMLRSMHDRAAICGGFDPAHRAVCELAYMDGGAKDARLIAQGMREDAR